MQMPLDQTEQLQTWRDNWFVKNILTEIPFIGPFFHAETIPDAVYYVGKYSSMLAGGSIGMMLDIFKAESNDSMAVSMAKDTTNMAIGMAIGNMAFNTLFSVGKKSLEVINDCRKASTEDSDLLLSDPTTDHKL